MAVDIITLPSTVAVSNRVITAINTSTKTLTLSGATFNTVLSQVLVRTGNVNREWTGLTSIVSDTGTLYNVDPTVEAVWKSTVNATGGAVAEGTFTKMADDISVAGGGTPTVIFTTKGVRRAYANLLTQQRQFVNVKEFTGGFGGISFITDDGEIPIVTDNDAPPGTAWFLNEKELKLYREADWSFMDEDGSKWQRVITSAGRFDAYEAILFQYSELGTHRRNAHGVVRGLTEQ
jgi:hypothetical protein